MGIKQMRPETKKTSTQFNHSVKNQHHQYKVVRLQSLQRKKQTKVASVPIEALVNKLDKPNQDQFYESPKSKNKLEEMLYCYKDTATNENRILSRFNNFFNAFYCPYNDHGDILLVPDDIWLMIMLFLSKYIDKNAEKLRKMFVKHEGQKQLTIIQYADSVEQSLKKQKQWDFFFTQIIKEIDKNTIPGTVEALSCNFSTTTQIYKLISTSIIMSSFKQYFSYGRMILGCGLDNVYFAGTREDWVKVYQKLKGLQKYDVDGALKKYIVHVQAIIENFIKTYDQSPNLKWWNTIMTSEQRRVGSGGQKDTFVEGWILHLYGIYGKVEIESIPKTLVSVPIKMVNQLTKTEKSLQLMADWVSVSKIDEYIYKPDIGVCIVERSRKQLN